MNLTKEEQLKAIIRMPHVCGDEPGYDLSELRRHLYAPRMWG